jgi:uncharacterized protein YkuJ
VEDTGSRKEYAAAFRRLGKVIQLLAYFNLPEKNVFPKKRNQIYTYININMIELR